ncbi:MAG: class I SAM-dependent methyltransferase [Acidobacteriota bacterium]
MTDAPPAGLIGRLRRQIQKNRYSSNPILKGSTLLVRTPLYLWQFATDGFYRTTILNRLKNPKSLHLTCNYTKLDRYPEIFSLARRYFDERGHADGEGLRLLSFGCSTGEEALSLRQYFPQAEIVGVDISEWNLKQARQKVEDPKIRFLFSDADTLADEGPFDGMFCMAVLLRIAHHMAPAESSAETYPIGQFEDQLRELDRHLNPAGLLVVYHTNYHFRDTGLAAGYEVLPGTFSERDLTPKYGPDHRLLDDPDTDERLFIKRAE